MYEVGRQAGARRPLLDDLTACAGVCVKAGADSRELRLESVAGHEADATGSLDRSGRLTRSVVGPVGRWAEQRATSRMPEPVIDHYEHDPCHDHLDRERAMG